MNKSLNLLPKLKREVKKKQEAERKKLFEERTGNKKKKATKKKTETKSDTKKVGCPLKGLLGGKIIYVNYKGIKYKAWVFNNGRIKYDGQIYDSPSTVGSVIRGGKSTNGWRFWKYKNKSGELVYISELRK